MMNTAALQRLIRHHREQPRSVGFDADGDERWQAILQKLDELVHPVAAEEEAVMKSRQLSDQGQQEARMKIGPRVVGNFVNMGVVLSEADKAKARLEGVLFTPLTEPPKGHEVVIFLQDQELRRTIGKREANAAFLKAAAIGDVDTTRALLSAPGPAWVSDENQKRGREAFARNTNPIAWEQLQYVEFLRDHLSALSGQVAQWLLTLGASAESVQKATKAKD